jgi:Holliday junction DNA helicase RuvA
MIERLTGIPVLKTLTSLVLDVNGIGYGLEMTDAALAAIDVPSTPAAPMTVWVHTHVREDAIRLFGFISYEEKTLFNLLISIAGVGPKLAMGILGHLSAAQLLDAVERDDGDVLEEVPGIGARQSKKILLELKPKLTKLLAANAFTVATRQSALALGLGIEGATKADAAPAPEAVVPGLGSAKKPKTLDKRTLADLGSALENFGYKEKELAPILRRFERAPPAADLAELVRLALAELSGAARAESARPLEEIF